MSKTALIIGISGQDGAFLAKFLLKKGYIVYGTSRDISTTKFNNLKLLNIYESINLFSMSLNSVDLICDQISTIKPDEIYNLSGQSSVGKSFSTPIETFESIANATLNILEAIRLSKIETKFFNAGSGECFDNPSIIDENTRFNPTSPYSIAKASAFWSVKNYRDVYGLFASTGFLFNHESYFRTDSFVTKKIIKTVCNIYKKSEDKLYLGNTDIFKDWGWAEEYVEAIYLMLQSDIADDFVIATGETRSLNDFIKIAFEYFNLNYMDYVVIDKALFRPSDKNIDTIDVSKIASKLNWRAKLKLEDIVEKMIKFELYGEI